MADPDIGVQIDGLLETAAAAARMARTIDSEAERALTDDAKTVVKEARAAMMRREGGGTYRRDTGDIGSVGSRVAIRRGGTAVGAEFGAVTAWVFGRTTSQSALRRRQYAPYRKAGWLVGPLYSKSRKVVDRQVELTEDLMTTVVDRSLRREGVPR